MQPKKLSKGFYRLRMNGFQRSSTPDSLYKKDLLAAQTPMVSRFSSQLVGTCIRNNNFQWRMPVSLPYETHCDRCS